MPTFPDRAPAAAATPPAAPPLQRRKLHHRLTPFMFAFYMAAIMALLMCCVIVAANSGIDATYPLRVLHAYAVAMPAAFCCILFVRPLVLRLVAATVQARP